eukprot:6457862-Amphidinium_carterae.1
MAGVAASASPLRLFLWRSSTLYQVPCVAHNGCHRHASRRPGAGLDRVGPAHTLAWYRHEDG